MQERRQPEIVSGRVNADGSIAAMSGGEFTVGKTGTGTYALTFASGFRLVSCHPTSAATGNFGATASAYGERTVTIGMLSAGAAADLPFAFAAHGVPT